MLGQRRRRLPGPSALSTRHLLCVTTIYVRAGRHACVDAGTEVLRHVVIIHTVWVVLHVDVLGKTLHDLMRGA